MAARTTSTTATQPSGSYEGMKAVSERVRTVLARERSDAGTLQQSASDIAQQLAAGRAHLEALRGQSKAALRTSDEAHDANVAAITATQRELDRLELLQQDVAEELAKATDVEFENSVRAVLLRTRELRDRVLSKLPEYEKHARAIAEVLEEHETLFNMRNSNVSYVLGEAVRSGQRSKQWAEALVKEILGDESEMNQLEVRGQDSLFRLVQLPAPNHARPFFGDIQSTAISKPPVIVPRDPDAPRKPMVQDAEGNAVNQHWGPNYAGRAHSAGVY